MILIDNLVSFISTKELKGNFIKLIKFNYIKMEQKDVVLFSNQTFSSNIDKFILV